MYGLQQHIKGTQSTGLYLVSPELVSGHHEHIEGPARNLAVQFSDDLKARPVRQPKIKQDHVGLVGTCEPNGLACSGCAQESYVRQVRLKHCGNEKVAHIVVLNTEDSTRNALPDVRDRHVPPSKESGNYEHDPVTPVMERTPHSEREAREDLASAALQLRSMVSLSTIF